MPDKPVLDSPGEKRSTGSWRPAIRMGLAFIAVLIIRFVFEIAIRIAFILLENEGVMFPGQYNDYPLYDVLYYSAYGILLLIIAGFLVGGNSWKEALSNRLQLIPDKRKAILLCKGVIIGVIVAAGTTLSFYFTDAVLYGGYFYVWLHPGLLFTAILHMLPMLVMAIGLVALLQGYYQRTLTDRYGNLEGLIGVGLLYLLLTIFPEDLWSLAFPSFSAGYVLMGLIIGYLYLVSRSLYLPIGFTFATNFFPELSYSVSNVINYPDQTFIGISRGYGISFARIAAYLLALSLVWYLYRSPGERPGDRLKGLGHSLQHYFSKLIGS